MDSIPIEIFCHIQSHLTFKESILLKVVSKGWHACIESYLSMHKIKPTKIILLCDLIDRNHRPKISNANLARYILYHIFNTRNGSALKYYEKDHLFQDLIERQAALFHLKNQLPFVDPNTDLIPEDKLNTEHSLFSGYMKTEISKIIGDVLKEALFFGEEELARMIVANYTSNLSDVDEYLDHASDQFILYFISKIEPEEYTLTIQYLLDAKRYSLVEQIVYDKLIALRNFDTKYLVKHENIPLLKYAIHTGQTSLVELIHESILYQAKFHLFEQLGIKPNEAKIRKVLFGTNTKSVKEKTIIELAKRSLIPENIKNTVLSESISRNLFDAVTVLVENMDTLDRYYYNYINSVSMFDYLSDKIIDIEYTSEYGVNQALCHDNIELAKRFYHLDSKPSNLIKIKIAEEKPHLKKILFKFWEKHALELRNLNKFHKLSQEDVKWLLENDYPYIPSLLEKYYADDKTMIEWLEINGYLNKKLN